MGYVQVPVSWLLGTGLTPSEQVIRMALRLHPSATPADLERYTGLSRPTILAGMSHAADAPKRGHSVKVPAALLTDPTVSAGAKVLYGLLQTTLGFEGDHGQFTYASLSTAVRLARGTLRRAVAELVESGWVQVSQASRVSPIQFTLPELRRSQAAVETARRRLKRARFGGEAIMQEYLTLLIDSDQFTDNARPGFLINPLTEERLELDRFYLPGVAFEFHGAQHDHATARFSQTQVDTQRLRDLIKAGLCLYQGIHLIIVRAEDLSLQGIIRKIGQSLPLRSLTASHAPLIDLLETASLTYRAHAQA